LPAGVVEAIAAVKKTLQAAGFGAVEEYLLREFQPARHGPDQTARFRNHLNLILQEMRDSPGLRAVFEAHAVLEGYTRTQERGVNAMPDFPSDRYKDRQDDEDILGFLRRVWFPYLYYGFANAQDIKAVDPEAFKAIPWPKARYKPRENLDQFLNEHWKALIELDLATRKFINSYDAGLGVAIANRVKGSGYLEFEPVTLQALNSRALNSKAVPARHAARISSARTNRLRNLGQPPER
jgi:hypothetical protein